MGRFEVVVTAVLVASAFACSDHAGNPTLTDNPRTYTCSGVVPDIPEKLGGATFPELYDDFFRQHGVAGCQTPGCHGDDHGSDGLSMQDPRIDVPGGNPAGVFCGLTKYSYGDKALVTSDPGRDTSGQSSLMDVIGIKANFMPYPLCGAGSNRHLTASELVRIQDWIRTGAPWGYATPVPKCSDDGFPCDQAPKGAKGCP